jgi:hypothetical protein
MPLNLLPPADGGHSNRVHVAGGSKSRATGGRRHVSSFILCPMCKHKSLVHRGVSIEWRLGRGGRPLARESIVSLLVLSDDSLSLLSFIVSESKANSRPMASGMSLGSLYRGRDSDSV